MIIRLENLSWSADAADVRQYFRGLSIPNGGVYIVGGEKGEAFVKFRCPHIVVNVHEYHNRGFAL